MIWNGDVLEKLNPICRCGRNLYLDNKWILYKLFDSRYYFGEDVERNVDFWISYDIPNVVKVYDKIYFDDKFYGYTMEYIKNSITFREAIGRDIRYEDKVSAILDVYEALRYLHGYGMIIGDIHLDNFLYVNGRGYVIDLDNMTSVNGSFIFKQKYCVRLRHDGCKINEVSRYIDNIKVMLCSLSLIYGIDLEDFISSYSHDINLEFVYDYLIRFLKCKDFDEYFSLLFNKGDVSYFDELLCNKGTGKKLKM